MGFLEGADSYQGTAMQYSLSLRGTSAHSAGSCGGAHLQYAPCTVQIVLDGPLLKVFYCPLSRLDHGD